MKYDRYIEKIKIVNWLNNFIYVKEIKLIEGKENNDLQQRKYEILKEKCALQEKEISELKEKLRVGVAEKKNNDFNRLRTERQNIKLLRQNGFIDNFIIYREKGKKRLEAISGNH